MRKRGFRGRRWREGKGEGEDTRLELVYRYSTTTSIDRQMVIITAKRIVME